MSLIRVRYLLYSYLMGGTRRSRGGSVAAKPRCFGVSVAAMRHSVSVAALRRGVSVAAAPLGDSVAAVRRGVSVAAAPLGVSVIR